MKSVSLTQQRLQELFAYDPETGLLTRKVRVGSRGPIGQVVGSSVGAGYLAVSIYYEKFILHRLIWLYVYGDWPQHDIDHINGIKTDNRLANLRHVTRSENQHNMRSRKNNTSSVVGVRRSASKNGWRARITVNSKEIHIGSYPTSAQAAEAYRAAKKIYHPTAPI